MSDLKFTEDHEWIRLEDGIATVGITDHAQNALGDIVFVELPEVGRQVEAAEACAVVESVKAASDVYAPIAGTVVEANGAIVDEPALINRSPQEEGWFFRLQVDDASALDDLMDAEAYAAFVADL